MQYHRCLWWSILRGNKKERGAGRARVRKKRKKNGKQEKSCKPVELLVCFLSRVFPDGASRQNKLHVVDPTCTVSLQLSSLYSIIESTERTKNCRIFIFFLRKAKEMRKFSSFLPFSRPGSIFLFRSIGRYWKIMAFLKFRTRSRNTNSCPWTAWKIIRSNYVNNDRVLRRGKVFFYHALALLSQPIMYTEAFWHKGSDRRASSWVLRCIFFDGFSDCCVVRTIVRAQHWV